MTMTKKQAVTKITKAVKGVKTLAAKRRELIAGANDYIISKCKGCGISMLTEKKVKKTAKKVVKKVAKKVKK
jgi:2-phosphoglycerate kinase